jgi:hypothetical protein
MGTQQLEEKAISPQRRRGAEEIKCPMGHDVRKEGFTVRCELTETWIPVGGIPARIGSATMPINVYCFLCDGLVSGADAFFRRLKS